jgi:hypothetical protein
MNEPQETQPKPEAGLPLGAASLSPTMKECADRIRSHCGVIVRYPGGFWCVENTAGETVAPTYGTTTVEALVKRGVLQYCEWRENRNGRFPTRARMTPNVKVSDAPDSAAPNRKSTL